MTKVVHLIGLVAASTVLTGCGGETSGPATEPVTGTVLLDGTPVEAAAVVFQPGPAGGGTGCQAVTDKDGRFEMRTHVGGGEFKSGAIPGDYLVMISKLDSGPQQAFAKPNNLLPQKYSQPRTSGLKATVEVDGENDFEFPLTQ